MNPPLPNNGSGPGPSDLEAIIEKVAPERRADFLKWRERLRRYNDNDEVLAVVGYMDTLLVATERLARESPGAEQARIRQEFEALKAENNRVTAVFEKATRKIDDSVTKIAGFRQYLDLGWPLMSVLLAVVLTALIGAVWHDHAEQSEQAKRDQYEHTRSQTSEALFMSWLAYAGAKPSFEVTNQGHALTLKIAQGDQQNPKAWRMQGALPDPDRTTALVTFVAPSTPAPSPVAPSTARHR
jgi:hypothetical protein